MFTIHTVMARRPDFGKQDEILKEEDLKDLCHSLALLSLGHVQDFYKRAYERCRLSGHEFPAARSIQELVQAWKQLRKWR